MKDYERLQVWSKAHFLALAVHAVTKRFPREELHCLTSQMRRSSMSIASNIAEGCYRATDIDMARFLQMALGSAGELRYPPLYAFDLGYIPEKEYQALRGQVEEVMKMLYSFWRTLRSR